MKKYYIFLLLIAILSCKKSDFLNTKPDPSLVVPSTLEDYEAILNNDFSMNGEAGFGIVPALGESGADNYFVPDDIYASRLQPLYKRVYVWDKNVFQSEQIYDWNIPYQGIYITNIVLEGLPKLNVSTDEMERYKNATGIALFFRAHLFYQLAQVFAQAYDKDSATQLLGIPLRLTSSLTEKIYRSSLEETYQKIVADLKTAATLVPKIPSSATQPSVAACYGLLARTYLTMSKYDTALNYADSCLNLSHNLMDYNTLDTTSNYPFSILNPEAIFQCEMISAPDVMPINPYYSFVDTLLFSSYTNNDLRKSIYFKPREGYYYFTGSYSGYYGMFAGIATDELYLIRAECYARTGQGNLALQDVNTILENRYIKNTFTPYTPDNTPDVLGLIIDERQKELCFRGLRWSDLRRLNKEGANISLYRNVAGTEYLLPPNDARYVYPIPGPVLALNSSIEQNKR